MEGRMFTLYMLWYIQFDLCIDNTKIKKNDIARFKIVLANHYRLCYVFYMLQISLRI